MPLIPHLWNAKVVEWTRAGFHKMDEDMIGGSDTPGHAQSVVGMHLEVSESVLSLLPAQPGAPVMNLGRHSLITSFRSKRTTFGSSSALQQ